MNTDKLMKIGIAGAVAGAGSSYLLKGVSWIMSKIGSYTPVITAKLANPQIDINVSGSITGVNTGLSGWISNALGITVPSSMLYQLGMAALGGAILFILGSMLADAIPGMNKVNKLTATIFVGNLAAGIFLKSAALSIGISTLNLLIAFGINAAILSYVFRLADDELKLGLNPF